ncbi:hypothetical protein DSCA_11080 [Desulfosarcina alkanivorans]|uniref:Single cache domain-containing protein n=1 Tax=Desulfosarcina alkanivorans TaxID=571177 RepID=A0A5K7YDF9_9BACT|nr:hypothetical protein [Desulfosarcina alkanivorans]BBO67178.1 hypothetical protein DSCA_11080 [Desulfosarcina alkanivorans]
MKPENKTGRIKKTRWFTCLFIWWVVAVFFYLFIAAKENNLVERVRDKGIQTVLNSAQQAGLPLLERDVQALTRLTQDVHRMKGVVNVSIIDHKNKIIAYSNPDQLLRMPSKALPLKDGVSFWPHTLDDGTGAVCFSTDIIYAGTKIGAVFLAMDAGGSAGLTSGFFLSAVISFLLIIFVLLVVDFHGVRPLKAAMQERFRVWAYADGRLQDDRELICPVCGSHKPLNPSFLLQANLDRYPVVRSARKENGSAQLLIDKGINLREISRREDLGWLRRQMIHRCADIIKKLAGD